MGLGLWDWDYGTGTMGLGLWDWDYGTGTMGLGLWDWDYNHPETKLEIHQFRTQNACDMHYMLFAFPAIPPPTARMGTNSSELWGGGIAECKSERGAWGETNVEFAIF